MTIEGENNNVKKWSQLALTRMEADHLEPNPQNYSVYYHLASETMPALIVAYKDLMALGSISQQQCSELYQKHIIADKEMLFLKDASSVIDGELKKVMGLLSASSEGANQFGENLTTFTGQLTGAHSVEVLREAVNKIAEETHTISQQNQKLQGELQATTQQLVEVRGDFDRISKEAQIDTLTEIGNRKFFERELSRALQEAREEKSLLSVLMVDIDHFKKFNDAHGHLIGDQVLRLVARTLVENLKGRDIIARYGGEEFIILLPQTRLQDAERVANQLRGSLATKHIRKRGSNEVLGIITVSIGAGEYMLGEERDGLIGRADAALYKAKQTGRNKVVCAGPEEGQM